MRGCHPSAHTEVRGQQCTSHFPPPPLDLGETALAEAPLPWSLPKEQRYQQIGVVPGLQPSQTPACRVPKLQQNAAVPCALCPRIAEQNCGRERALEGVGP